MNNRTSFALLVVLTAVGTLTMSSAYASKCSIIMSICWSPEDAKALANKMLLEALPVSVWTDQNRLWSQ